MGTAVDAFVQQLAGCKVGSAACDGEVGRPPVGAVVHRVHSAGSVGAVPHYLDRPGSENGGRLAAQPQLRAGWDN